MTGDDQFSENHFSNAELEQAVAEIRRDDVEDAVIEAAAARVWNRIAAKAAPEGPSHAIRDCGDFQTLFPEYRARTLPPARAMLVEDHLHQCVACRRIYEGRVAVMPAPKSAAKTAYPMRWAAAAVVVAAAGLSVWIYVNRGASGPGRAIVQSVNGTLFEVSASGIRPLAVGEQLRDGVEVRTASDTDAFLALRDGSVVEMRERSGMSEDSSAQDLTIHLTRGSVIVQAAHRSSGHLYVVTPECRVAVTGTLFGVTAGVKGSRVSVLEGEVHVSQEHQEKVLHAGDQSVAGDGMEPEPLRDDIAWSQNRDRYFTLLASMRKEIQNVALPGIRHDSRLIDRLPADTMLYASVPNLGDYLGKAEAVFRGKAEENPGLAGGMNSRGLDVLEKLRAASQYLGNEVVVAGEPDGRGGMAFAFLAEVTHEGFADFLKQNGQAVETRNGFVVFGPNQAAVTQFAPALTTASGGFAGTPFYQQIERQYQEGAGLLFCLDLAKNTRAQMPNGPRYLLAGQKEIDHRTEASATLVFDHDRQGMAAWLAEPAPMQSLDYFRPEAALAGAFVTRNSASIVDAVSGLLERFGAKMDSTAPGLREDLAASLGGEFAVGFDGAAVPVPSWKLVVEVYDPARFRSALDRAVQAYDAYAVKSGGLALRTKQETVDGRTYYMVAGGDPNPLTEAYYTFADGYMIAAPSEGLLKQAIEARTSRNSLVRSQQFLSLAPLDRHANFSGVIYQNLAPTVAPIAGLLEGFLPPQAGQSGVVKRLSNIKPSLIAAYGERDRLTVATDDNVFGGSLTDLMTGNVAGIMGNLMPMPQFHEHHREAVRR